MEQAPEFNWTDNHLAIATQIPSTNLTTRGVSTNQLFRRSSSKIGNDVEGTYSPVTDGITTIARLSALFSYRIPATQSPTPE
jgi:hypothetical protein